MKAGMDNSFYKDLFKTASTKDIVLALLSLFKSSQNAEKVTTIKVFEKVMESIASISNDIEYSNKEQQMQCIRWAT